MITRPVKFSIVVLPLFVVMGFAALSIAQEDIRQLPLSMQMKNQLKASHVKIAQVKKMADDSEDEDLASQTEKTLNDMDAVVDTGIDVSKDKYTFGARQNLDENTRLSFGVGAKMNNSADYNMSATHRAEDSRTNYIEQNFNPLNASPIVGVELGYKF